MDQKLTQKTAEATSISIRAMQQTITNLSSENLNLKLRVEVLHNQKLKYKTTTDTSILKELHITKEENVKLHNELEQNKKYLKEISVVEQKQNETSIMRDSRILQLKESVHNLKRIVRKKNQEITNLTSRKSDELQMLRKMCNNQDFLLQAANKQIFALNNELRNCEESMLSYDDKVKEMAINNSDLVDKNEEHTKCNLIAKEMAQFQKKQLEETLLNKEGYRQTIHNVAPELKRQEVIIRGLAEDMNNALAARKQKDEDFKSQISECYATIFLLQKGLKLSQNKNSKYEREILKLKLAKYRQQDLRDIFNPRAEAETPPTKPSNERNESRNQSARKSVSINSLRLFSNLRKYR